MGPIAMMFNPQNNGDAGYQKWRGALPKPLQSEQDYDLRGFYQENPTFTASPGQHMTDKFKLPNHPTFSNESKFYTPENAHMGGKWDGETFMPNKPVTFDEGMDFFADQRQQALQDPQMRRRQDDIDPSGTMYLNPEDDPFYHGPRQGMPTTQAYEAARTGGAQQPPAGQVAQLMQLLGGQR